MDSLLTITLTLGFLVVVFLVFRALVLWYWKVDTIIENQEKQIALLRRIAGEDTIADKARKYDAIEEAKKREHSKI